MLRLNEVNFENVFKRKVFGNISVHSSFNQFCPTNLIMCSLVSALWWSVDALCLKERFKKVYYILFKFNWKVVRSSHFGGWLREGNLKEPFWIQSWIKTNFGKENRLTNSENQNYQISSNFKAAQIFIALW
jgi:hypothetical protein